MDSKMIDFTKKLLLLLEAPSGSQLQELVDELMMNLQLRITDRTARKTAACVLADRVFEVLIRAFAADSRMMEHEDKALFLALYRVFYTDEFEEEPLPPTENAVDLLRRMQAEFGHRKKYEACVAYFRRIFSLASMSLRVEASLAIMTLRICDASPLMKCPPSNPFSITPFSRSIISITLHSRARSIALK